jgi:hypothetical protein
LAGYDLETNPGKTNKASAGATLPILSSQIVLDGG